jgi:hypothetical protein
MIDEFGIIHHTTITRNSEITIYESDADDAPNTDQFARGIDQSTSEETTEPTTSEFKEESVTQDSVSSRDRWCQHHTPTRM